MNEAEIFEYLKEQAQKHNVASISLALSSYSGAYAAVYAQSGECKIASTIYEAVSQLAGPEQQAADMLGKADKLEAEATELREQAGKLLAEKQP